MPSLHVWQNGELVGEWEHSGSKTDRFRYAESWMASKQSRPLSLSWIWPVPAGEWITGRIVEDWFANLLPDSKLIQEQIARRFGVPATPFDLLREIGRDCVGAVQLLPVGESPEQLKSIRFEPWTEEQVEEELRRTANPSLPWADDDTPFRFSLAGAQEKTALLFHEGQWCRPMGATPTTHILKLPIGGFGEVEMPHSLENEWLCGRLLTAWGLQVAESEILHFGQRSCLAVKRFDRRLAQDGTWWMRLPQEDLCQALGVPPHRKYESEGGPGIRDCADLLHQGLMAREDVWSFLKAQFLFWLLQAPDGHGKNLSIQLHAGGRFQLTPLYDVMSAYPISGHGRWKLPTQQIRMAMAVSGKNRHYRWVEILPRHWQATAASLGMAEEMKEFLETLSSLVADGFQEVESQLPRGFPEQLFEEVRDGVKGAESRIGGL